MAKVEEIKQLLEKIQRTNAKQRVIYINKVQRIIGDQTIALNLDLQQELLELSDELNYYEQNIQQGDLFEERLLEKISTAIEKIDAFLEEK